MKKEWNYFPFFIYLSIYLSKKKKKRTVKNLIRMKKERNHFSTFIRNTSCCSQSWLLFPIRQWFHFCFWFLEVSVVFLFCFLFFFLTMCNGVVKKSFFFMLKWRKKQRSSGLNWYGRRMGGSRQPGRPKWKRRTG